MSFSFFLGENSHRGCLEGAGMITMMPYGELDSAQNPKFFWVGYKTLKFEDRTGWLENQEKV